MGICVKEDDGTEKKKKKSLFNIERHTFGGDSIRGEEGPLYAANLAHLPLDGLGPGQTM